jgi:hypothetical protein
MRRKLKDKNVIKKGPRRVEAWVYTVINPLIEALKVEKSFLKEKNWTWRFQIKSLEFILPLEKYVDSASLPNFEDFLRANPQVERKRRKHDDLRAKLSENCEIAFNCLIASDPFEDRVKLFLSIYEKEKPAEEFPGGAVPEKDFDKLVAQYIVNSIKELPGHYTASKFWSRFGGELLQFRTGDVFENLDASGEQLENEDDRLLKSLEDLRSTLCENYDIPAAPVYYYDLAGQGR